MYKSSNDSGQKMRDHTNDTDESPNSQPQDKLKKNAHPSTIDTEGIKDKSKDQDMLQASMGLSRRDIELRKRIAKKFGR